MKIKRNGNLHVARNNKCDEFYTRYEDIEAELKHYDFSGMSVCSPCDDYRSSNFVRYFTDHFAELGITQYCATNYNLGDGAWKYEYDGKDITITELHGDGDFRSNEVRGLIARADVVITNPPFSMFREFLAILVDYDVKFSVIGNQNAVAYRDVFPLVKNGRVWWGASGCVRWFLIPDDVDMPIKVISSCERLAEGARSRWYTNIDYGRRHQPLSLRNMAENIKYSKYKAVNGLEYLRYANYDAIDVPYTEAIPIDYDGVMGVPLTFLDKYCPEQFEIIGYPHGDEGLALGLTPYDRNLKKQCNGLRDGDLYYIDRDGVPSVPYSRILIRRRK